MEIVGLPMNSIIAAQWNPNEMDTDMLSQLRHSVRRFDLVVPLVVRNVGDNRYETIGGAQRLSMLRELGMTTAPCVVVEADDSEARLLGQALNHVAGSDNLGLRAQVMREILEDKSPEEVMALLPETAESLQALTAIDEQSISQALKQWEQTQKARLRHLTFQLTDAQLEVVEEVLRRLIPLVAVNDQSPNQRGAALHLLCLGFLDREPSIESPIEEEERP